LFVTHVFRWLLALFVAVLVGLIAFAYFTSRPLYHEQRSTYEPLVADPAEALTFARNAGGLLLVREHHANAVSGIDLSRIYGVAETADLLTFFHRIGPDELRELQAQNIRVPLADLILPVNYQSPYIAAGTNFSDHAEEVYHDDPPFLFPKLTAASDWQAGVPFVPRLDFEAELCAFPLKDIEDPEQQPGFGFVLCNDFTDRWTLIRDIDLGGPMGLTGFAAGKGCEKCMPTGYLVVIPSAGDFYQSIDVSLFVNDHLRQRFTMRHILWPLDEIVRMSFRMKDLPFENGAKVVDIMPLDRIPRGTLILTGTAGGVIFKPANILFQNYYLQPGDVVRTEATYLGFLRNEVYR
jgi:2-keto-4-pentenoate hydratase/2-oxohepta-3-ene-1,7-dioic acid hydratase in catechol pathway